MADGAKIEVIDAGLRAHLDRVSDGAATRFLDGARAVLQPIVDDARVRAPFDTGEFARSFRLEERLRETSLEVSAVNDARHARFVRWSVRTRASLDAEADRAAAKGETMARRRAIRSFIRRRLTRRHGEGAPDAQIAGKHALTELIRKPGKRAATKFIEDQRQALADLARKG